MNWKKLSLIIIIGLAAFFRLWKLQTLPRDAHVDEIMNAYVGQFTIRNGVDLYGNPWPILYFDNFGDFPNILPMYLSGLSTLLFGNFEWAIRLPIAIFGIFGVYMVYLLAKLVYAKQESALFAALTLAIFPWHINLSRATAEGVTASSVFLLGIYLILRYLPQKSRLLLIIGFLLMLLTYLLYPSYRITVPLALLPLFLLTKERWWKAMLLSFSGIALGLTLFISQTNWGTGRFEQTSLLGTNSPVWPIQSELIIGEGSSNALKARLLYNKFFMIGREFVNQYLSYFSVDFLFDKGGLPMRYFVPNVGVWYYSYLILIVGLLAFSLIKSQEFNKHLKQHLKDQQAGKIAIYLIYLLAISPLVSALTIDDTPNVHRAALLPITLSLLAGFLPMAFQVFPKLRWRIIGAIFLTAVLCFETIDAWNKYQVHSSKYQYIYRSPAIKELSSYLKNKSPQVGAIFVEKKGEAAIYYLFYNQIYDKQLSKEFQTKLQISKVNNIYFTEHGCVSPEFVSNSMVTGRNLFVLGNTCIREYTQIWKSYPNLKEIDVLRSKQGDIIFRVYELNIQ